MNRFLYTHVAKLLKAGACAVMLFAAGGVAVAAQALDESQLLEHGFKVLVATTDAQQKWVRGLPPGKFRPMQRTGKKFYIYPDASRNQVYVGGPKEYEAYVQAHPETRVADAGTAARQESAYRMKQSDAMEKASSRDLSDPFLGAAWSDLGW